MREKRACRAFEISKTAFRCKPVKRPDEDKLHSRIIELCCQYGRVGYRMVTALLRNEGYNVNHKRVERIWREEGLKLPRKQPKRRRIWANDGGCVRLRAEYKNHVWSYDFVEDKTTKGLKIRFLNIIDEYTREYLACIPRFSWNHLNVIEILADIRTRLSGIYSKR